MTELSGVPPLRDPVMVAAFEGWNDAGEAASGAVAHLERVWGDDWPLWKTSQLTLDKIRRAVPSILEEPASTRVLRSIAGVQTVLDSGRKGLRWKLRARVGERVRWYELPEEVG